MSQTQFTQPLIQQSSPVGSLGFGGTFIPAISLLARAMSDLRSRREEPEEPKTMRAFARVSSLMASRDSADAGVVGVVGCGWSLDVVVGGVLSEGFWREERISA